ncbi:family 16 glycosylhydrolase [Pseudonocardia bannensis]|uniref:Glycoside hydrolase family 16 protein n=1 Tax=Pseudonocardia bannensis TaxID=630973 RepID=A0A848DCW0_9PSEU|nr:glycoside hydrolase family 16 protein [Pseudonocardia bannensis]NMH90430.1 glycoside hydrolase family 16 protein [Pseudonocardia bannensis]
MFVGLEAGRYLAAAVMLAATSLPAGGAGAILSGGTPPAVVDCAVAPDDVGCLPGGDPVDPGYALDPGLEPGSDDLSGGFATHSDSGTSPDSDSLSVESPSVEDGSGPGAADAGSSDSGATDSGTSGSGSSDSGSSDSGSSDSGSSDGGSSGTGSEDGASSGDGDRTSDNGGLPSCTPLQSDGSSSAAQLNGWGTPERVEEFDDAELAQWELYSGTGFDGKGRRSPDAVSVTDGLLTITGDARGTTGGLAWDFGSQYGRWEGRVRAPVSDPSYTALMLLWPDAQDFPTGGEIDFMEMADPTRQRTNAFIHYGPDNAQIGGEICIDATRWHNWAVEWTPARITMFVDGREWWSTTETDAFPPRPMHMTIQLDWFSQGDGDVQPSEMVVDWVRFYPATGAGPSPQENNADAASSTR